MSIFSWGFIFLATGVVLTIFVLALPLFIRAPKNQPTIIAIAGMTLTLLIFTQVIFLLINRAQYSSVAEDAAYFGFIFTSVSPAVLACICLQVLFFRSLRKSILELKVFFIVLIFICIYLIGLFIYSRGALIAGYPASDAKIPLLRSSSFFLLMVWFFYEVTKGKLYKHNFIIILMRVLSSLFALLTLTWIIFLLIDFSQSQYLSRQLGGLAYLDLNIRFIRLLVFCIFQILFFLYWIQNYSLSAIEERQSQQEIKNLLLEKEVLIETLANKTALVESGALSAGLAHELNQFLSRIQLNADEALELIKLGSADPENLKQSLEGILKANHSAARLIVSMKKLFHTGADGCSKCIVDQLVLDTISLYSGRATKSYIRIEADLQVEDGQMVSESLLRQVIVNLISNAIEALDTVSRPDKHILIRSHVDVKGNYCLTVTDNGPGINPDQASKMFGLFASSKSYGAGIGLWLSKYIIERHQGFLIYENLPDREGVRFIMTLPKDFKP